jgi:hypothetical protein
LCPAHGESRRSSGELATVTVELIDRGVAGVFPTIRDELHAGTKDAEAADLKAALCERDDSNATLQGELDKLHAASRPSQTLSGEVTTHSSARSTTAPPRLWS